MVLTDELLGVIHTVDESNDWAIHAVLGSFGVLRIDPCNLFLHAELRLFLNNYAGVIQVESEYE
ncbi:hypothetical protein [Kosakonia sp. YIM B13571]